MYLHELVRRTIFGLSVRGHLALDTMAVNGPRPCQGHAARRQHRVILAVLAVCGAAAWYGTARSFLAASGPGLGRSDRSVVARKAGYTFGLSSSEDHKGLLTAQKDNAYRVSTEGSFLSGHYNTVLGDQEIPQSGRSYWEVKIVTKPSDAWEFIGVAEPTADVTMPLHKNKKGKGWFWGGDWSESFIYTFMEMKPGMNDKKMAHHKLISDTAAAPSSLCCGTRIPSWLVGNWCTMHSDAVTQWYRVSIVMVRSSLTAAEWLSLVKLWSHFGDSVPAHGAGSLQICKEGMSSPLPPISPRPIYSASSAASAASGSTRKATDRLPALDSMSQMSARIQALSKQQVELKREIKEHFGRAASLMVARKAQDMSGGQIPGNAPTVRSFVVPRFK
eukprot:s5370_g7.t1